MNRLKAYLLGLTKMFDLGNKFQRESVYERKVLPIMFIERLPINKLNQDQSRSVCENFPEFGDPSKAKEKTERLFDE